MAASVDRGAGLGAHLLSVVTTLSRSTDPARCLSKANGIGTISTKKDGTERLNLTAFYEALLEA